MTASTPEASQIYIDRGFAVVPIPPGSKAPVVNGWQSKRFDASSFSAASNIGIVLGDPSGGLVDVDLDAEDARELADEILPPTDAVTGRPSSPRSHRWYIAKGATTRKFTDPTTRKMIVELRSTGCQTVVGPSIHPSGEQYEPLTDIPTEIDAGYLLECVENLWRAVLARRGIEPPKPQGPAQITHSMPADQSPPRIDPAPHSNECSNRHSNTPSNPCSNLLDVEHRALAYLNAMPPAISGQAGHAVAYSAATAMVHGFGLDQEAAFNLLWTTYNPRCAPPWSERELRHKVKSAATQAHSKPYGWLRDEQSPLYIAESYPDVDISGLASASVVAAAPKKSGGPIILTMADVEPQKIAWLWSGRIPLGRLSLLVGRPGEGKSFLTTDMAARVSTGTPWPDGTPCPRGDVLFMACEDDPSDTIRPRLDAAGADCRKVHLIKSVIRPSVNGDQEFLISLADTDEIASGLELFPATKLMIVDPIGSFLGGKADAHRDNEVRGVLAPIAKLAEDYGVAVLLVAHRRKSFSGHADDTAMGSVAFTGIARAAWHLSRDPNDKLRRLLLPGKNNLGPEASGLAFSIGGLPAKLHWESDAVFMSADDGLHAEQDAMERKSGPEAESQNDAETWLQTALHDGPRAAKELADEWVNGESGSKRTLERAKSTLGVKAFRPENPGPWFWKLEQSATPQCQSPNCEELGGLGGVPQNPRVLPLFETPEQHTAKLSVLGGVPLDASPLGGAA